MKRIDLKNAGKFITGINLIVFIVIANAILNFIPNLKVDFTKEKIHTLSPATKQIIKNLDDVVKVKVYMTQDLPTEVKPVATNLRTILGEFNRLNSSKFTVEYVDPSKDTTIKNEAERNGIQPLQFSSMKSDKLEVSNGYLGLKVSYGNKQEVLPVAGDVGNIEYFLISSIKKLTGKDLPKVVMIEPANNSGGPQYNILSKLLGNNYQFQNRSLSDTSDIPKDTTVLILAGINQKIDDKVLTKIKDYLKENKAVLWLGGKAEIGNGMQANKLPETGLEDWLKDKGFVLEPKMVADASSTVASFRSGNSNFYTQYPYWLIIRPENVNRNLPVTSGINSLMMPWPTTLFLSGSAQSLFTTTDKVVVSDSFGDISPMTKVDLTKSSSRQILGGINTDAKVAVITDSMFIQDQFVQNYQENAILALNLVDYLSNDQALMSIRSKVISAYPLTQVSDRSKQLIRAGNIAGPLLFLLIIGIATNIIRKKNNKKWQVE